MRRLMGYKQTDQFGGGPLRRDEVVGEAQAHLYDFSSLLFDRILIDSLRIAGSETTATVAAFGIWLASQDPELLARIRVELDEHITDKVGTYADLYDPTKTPVFNAFIKERKTQFISFRIRETNILYKFFVFMASFPDQCTVSFLTPSPLVPIIFPKAQQSQLNLIRYIADQRSSLTRTRST